MKRTAPARVLPKVAPPRSSGSKSASGDPLAKLQELEQFEEEALKVASRLGFEGDPDEEFGGFIIAGVDPKTNRVRKLPVDTEVQGLGTPKVDKDGVEKFEKFLIAGQEVKNFHRIKGLTVRDAQLYLRKVRFECHLAHLNGLEPPTAEAVVTHLGLDKVEDAKDVLKTVKGWLNDVAKHELAAHS